MAGKVSQVVHLDEVEVVLTPYQMHPLFGPFNPHLISLLMAISDSCMVDLYSTLICHQFSQLLILAICAGVTSLRGMELEKNILCVVECLQVAFRVGKCIWCMTAILSQQREISPFANTFQRALEIMILSKVRISECGRNYSSNTMAESVDLLFLPLSDFAIGLFQYTEPGVKRNFFPSIVEFLLSFMLFQEFCHQLHYRFE